MKTTSEIFSANLRRLLEDKKKTQRALAKYVGATKATVSRWVNGEVVPRHARLDKVCEFLMCAPELQRKIADLQKTAPLKTQNFSADWQDVYAQLDDEHKRSFWRGLIKEIHTDVEISAFEIVY